MPWRRAAKAEAEAAQLRARIERLAYDAASRRYRTTGWNTGTAGPNDEVGAGAPLSRQRARDLVRNNPYASSAVEALASALVGDGIRPQVQIPRKVLVRAKRASSRWAVGEMVPAAEYVEYLWDRWQRECYRSSPLGFYGLQSVAARAMFEAGECLIRFRAARSEDGLTVPVQVQILEAEFLDDSRHGPTSNGYMVQGVQFDAVDRRLGYWLYPRHPGESYGGGSIASAFVPAEVIAHVYDPTHGRPGQVRGMPPLVSVALRLRNVDTYEDAELVRRKVAATLAILIQSEGDQPLSTSGTPNPLGVTVTASDGTAVDSLSPGLIATITGAESITAVQPPQVADYGPYMSNALHAIAAGIGLPYEELTGDLSGTNYSSIKFGRVKFLRRLGQIREQAFIPMACEPAWREFANAAIAAGELPPMDLPVKWQAPRSAEIDRAKEESGVALALANGTTSRRREIMRNGDDPEEINREIEEDLAWRKANGFGYPDVSIVVGAANTDGAVDESADAALGRVLRR